MKLDATTLSRLQFAWVIVWHILLPAFTMGIASYIALLEGLYLKTRRPIYLELSTFWKPRRAQSPCFWSYFTGQRGSRLGGEAPRI